MKEKKKILVTGASGLVGSAIVEGLLGIRNYETYGLFGNRSRIKNQKSLKKIFQGDISDSDIFQKTEDLNKTDVLIHTAGLAHQFDRLKKEEFWRVNVQGTENICKLAQKIGANHFVLISSVSVYGDYGADEIDETYICNPVGVYAESKLESENRAIQICDANGIRLTILRLATVTGEGDRGNISRLITTVDKGRFFWIGNGNNKKSLIYKEDVAKGVLKLVEAGADLGHEIYNLTAEAVTMKEVVKEIFRNLSKKTLPFSVPEKLVHQIFHLNSKTVSLEFLRKYEKTFEKWRSDDIFSGRKFYEKYDFKAQTAISEAIARQVKYYLSKKN